jgi:hypothetical protein
MLYLLNFVAGAQFFFQAQMRTDVSRSSCRRWAPEHRSAQNATLPLTTWLGATGSTWAFKQLWAHSAWTQPPHERGGRPACQAVSQSLPPCWSARIGPPEKRPGTKDEWNGSNRMIRDWPIRISRSTLLTLFIFLGLSRGRDVMWTCRAG